MCVKPTIALSKEYSLFSSNVLLEIVNYGYPVILRDSGAPVYPGHYTVAAGRCEQTPRQTALAELNQEFCIQIQHARTQNVCLLGFGDNIAAANGKAHKELGLKRQLPKLRTVPVEWTPSSDRYEVYLNDTLVEEGTAHIIYDAKTNAYEICFVGFVRLPANYAISELSDGDGFNRTVRFVDSLSKLADKPCVPALRSLLSL